MLNCQNLILFILPLPLFGILFLIFTPPKQIKLLKLIVLNFSCFSFTSFLIVWRFFKKSVGSFQFTKTLIWFPFLNLNVTLEVDGTSLFFIILTILLISLCLLASWNTINSNLKEFLIAFLFCGAAATINSITATSVADKFSALCLQGAGLNFVLGPISSKIFNFKISQLDN